MMVQINTRVLVLKNDLQCMIAASDLPPVIVGIVLDNIRAQVAVTESAAIARENEKPEENSNEKSSDETKGYRYDGENMRVVERNGE